MKGKITAALTLITVASLVGVGFTKVASAHEHAGKGDSCPHDSKKNKGKRDVCSQHAKEHPGTESHKITATEIKTAMKEHIDKMQKKGGGVFKLKDKDRKNQKLTLKFVKIHDPVRKVEGKGYFACTDFQVVDGDRNQLMDLDFWLSPNKKGKLVVTETKVHKDAVKNKEGKWTKKARYTFVNDKPVAIK
jgi:hypothetical protein